MRERKSEIRFTAERGLGSGKVVTSTVKVDQVTVLCIFRGKKERKVTKL